VTLVTAGSGSENRWRDASRALIVLGMVDAEIIDYYSHGQERDRLAAGRQRIEFLRIWDLLERWLPAPPAKLLDVGGGAGVGGMRLGPGGLDGTARFLTDGQHRNPGSDPAHFTTSYFHRPEELTAEIMDAGLELRQLVAASGSVKLLAGLSQYLDVPEQRDHVLSVLRLLEAEPSLIGMSQNFVAMAHASEVVSGGARLPARSRSCSSPARRNS
jgi:hypothetical protein